MTLNKKEWKDDKSGNKQVIKDDDYGDFAILYESKVNKKSDIQVEFF